MVPKCASDSVDALQAEAAGNATTVSEYSAQDHKTECGNFAETVKNNITNLDKFQEVQQKKTKNTQLDCCKLLGVIFQSNFKMDSHIEFIRSQCALVHKESKLVVDALRCFQPMHLAKQGGDGLVPRRREYQPGCSVHHRL